MTHAISELMHEIDTVMQALAPLYLIATLVCAVIWYSENKDTRSNKYYEVGAPATVLFLVLTIIGFALKLI